MSVRIAAAFVFLLWTFFSCSRIEETEFTPEALGQNVYDLQMKESTIGDVIAKHKGKKVMLDIWASWCKDCIKSLPDVREFQKENPDVEFIFLSVDDTEKDWKNGVDKYMKRFEVKGGQYFFNTGWEKNGSNEFVNFAGLDWIPRYMLLDENGKILVYYAKKLKEREIRDNL